MSAIEALQAGDLNLKAIVALAKDYLRSIAEQPVANLRLEEVERDREKGEWRITLGYDGKDPDELIPANSFAALLRDNNPHRSYRVITIDATTGEFVSMKWRNL